MKTTRREFIASVGATAGVASSSLLAQADPKQDQKSEKLAGKPNILVIMTDQHSKNFLGCYGNQIVRTPHLDRLASEGMRFSSTYCPAPVCVPSRMSFMTGRIPSRNRVWSNQCILSSGIPTWAHVLGAAGYETSLIGRMHFKGPDQRHGFENRLIGEPGASQPGHVYQCTDPNQRARAHYHGGSGQSRGCVTHAGRGKTTYQYFDEQRIPKACEYLRRHAKSPERPFAAVVGLTLPHCPFIAPKELYNYYAKRVDVPKIEPQQPATIRRFRKLRGILDPPLSEHQIRVARAAYYGLCEYVDLLIGQVLDCLDETGLAKNTLVVYTSDHGEMAGNHGCWWKSNYYEGSVGVPLIARLPGTIAPGAVSDAISNLMDLGPTFAEVAGTRMSSTDGHSLWPTMQGRHPKSWKNETVSELYEVSRMVRSGKWKLWVYVDSDNLPPALFNLEDDPDELHDLGQDPKYADIREELLQRVYQDWDPELVRSGRAQALEDFRTISRWTQAVKPPAPDSMRIPPPSYEADVELL